jgi:hypothetical protein
LPNLPKAPDVSCHIATNQNSLMTRYFIITFIALLTSNIYILGQTNHCNTKIIQLRFDKIQEVKSNNITDSLLTTAKLTETILVNEEAIKKFKIKLDSACCTYAGQMFLTSHQYLLTNKAVASLSSLQIPLCCGIPIAVFVDGKEIYRAMLWNSFSSFGNESITARLIGDTLTFVNQLPSIPDFRNGSLANKNDLINCLLSR